MRWLALKPLATDAWTIHLPISMGSGVFFLTSATGETTLRLCRRRLAAAWAAPVPEGPERTGAISGRADLQPPPQDEFARGAVRGLPGANSTMSRLFVGNIPPACSDADIQLWFERHGLTVESVQLVRDHVTGHSRGFAFVDVAGGADPQNLIERLNHQRMADRILTVGEAKPRPFQTRGL
jgi:hypothetical protein